MPASLELFPEQNYAIVTYSGDLTTEDIMQIRKLGQENPAFSPRMDVIDDITLVESTNIQFDQMNQLSSKSVAKSGVKRALVVKTEFQLGMANMYRTLSESYGHHFEIFDSMKQAKKWILFSENS